MQRTDEGEILYDLDSAEDWTEAFKDLLDTPVGQEYVEISDPETLKSDKNKILLAVATLNNRSDETGYYASLAQIVQALEKLMIRWRILRTAEEIKSLPVPAAPTVETPRLSSSQQLWHEFRVWTDSHSSSECRLRARSDEQYGNFYHKNLEREFGAQQVGDAVTPEGQPSGRHAVTAEIREFARLYHQTPISDLRPKGGLVRLGGREMSWSWFNQQLEAATAAGVI